MVKTLFSFLLLTLLFSCSKETEIEHIVNYNEKDFKLKQGVLFYNNLPFTGKLISKNKVSRLQSEVTYKKGKKHGEELITYAGGNLYEKRCYEKGVKTGIHKGWWNNGNVRFEYHFNTNGEYHGEVKEWYVNGQLLKSFHFINGKEKGSQKMWQSNGKIRANYVAKNGDRFGLIGLKKCYSVQTTDEKVK